ncbi:MAG: hypothetical protein AAF950_01075 [Pseudomonadota bacterium]
MPRILAIELAIFLSPFAAYWLYQMALRDAAAEGRKAWPIRALFGTGLALAVLAWLFLILREDRDRNICREPSRFDSETQQLIPGREYECDADIESIGERRRLNETDVEDTDDGTVPGTSQ